VVRLIFAPLVLFFSVISLVGCSTMMPERKEPTAKQEIREEDIGSRSGSVSSSEEGVPTQSSPVDPPATYGGQAQPQVQPPAPSQPVEPGTRAPRRYIWRDRGGGERSWDPAPRGER
jgi:hypothetical protein